MDVSIIIVNYNTKELLRNCINSILLMTIDIQYEVIVVDNGSSDCSIEMIENEFRFVNLLKLERNIGFGRANNKGIAIAKGRNVFLLNSDTVLLNNAVKILSSLIDSDSKIGVCGGNLYNCDFNSTHSYSMFYPDFLGEINLLTLTLLSKIIYGKNNYFNHTQKITKVAWVSGANMMIKKSILNMVGFFDEDFFMYCEEIELTQRIKRAGFLVVNSPHSKILHLEGASCKFSELKSRWGSLSRKLYLKKTYKSNFIIVFCNVIYLFTCLNFILFYKLKNDVEMLKIWKINLRYLFEKNLTY